MKNIKQAIGAAAAKIGQFVDEHKKGITAGIGGIFAVSQLASPFALAAQSNPIPYSQTINPNYNPVVGQLTKAFVIQKFERVMDAPNKKKADFYILDVDGDGRTMNDQKIMGTTTFKFTIGESIQFVEDYASVQFNIVYPEHVTRTR